jgi:hypothetical protein
MMIVDDGAVVEEDMPANIVNSAGRHSSGEEGE